MFRVVVDAPDIIGAWVIERGGGQWIPGQGTAIGIVDEDGRICSGIAFTDYNGRNMLCHICIEDFRALRTLILAAGRYAFYQAGCKRLTFIAEESNIRAVRLHEKLGAVREARLKGAGRNGDDILISCFTEESPFWKKLNGKVECSTAAKLRGADPSPRTVEYQSVQHDAQCIAGKHDHAVRKADLV